MKVIVTGSRDIVDYDLVSSAIKDSNFDIDELVSGGARGVDSLGEEYAKENGIQIKRFVPDWSIGKVAGFIRNTQMAQYADALIAIWDGESSGTRHMIEQAKRHNLKMYVVVIGGKIL